MDSWTDVMDLAHETIELVHAFFFRKLNLLNPKNYILPPKLFSKFYFSPYKFIFRPLINFL
jgi:hypothetical protein